MFDSIARLFGVEQTPAEKPMDTRLAVAALLVHLAAVDGNLSRIELKTLSNALKDHYGLDEPQVKKLVAEAKRKDREAVDFYQFTAQLARLEPTEKTEIIRMMWQVVFSDDTNHELEDNMVWRVAELIGVPSRERTILRKQIRAASTSADDETLD